MKKSKIIIPAAAILALSVGASITGTVAWFTAARSVNVNVKNLAAIDTAGDLSVVLKPVTEGGATVLDHDVTLTALRDASYDGAKIYGCTTDTGAVDGKDVEVVRVTGTQEITNTPVTVMAGSKSVQIYAINQWDATFKTSSQFSTFLCFEPVKSKLTDFVPGDSTETSIYNALRVMMQVSDSSQEGYEKTVVWAPYTNDRTSNTVYHVKEAGTVKTPFEAATKVFDANNYKKDETNSLIETFQNVTNNDVYTETSAIATVKAGKNTLSSSLKSDNNVDVRFTVWFEGIDSDSVSTAANLNNLAGYTVEKVMNLSFYSLPKSGMLGYDPSVDNQ